MIMIMIANLFYRLTVLTTLTLLSLSANAYTFDDLGTLGGIYSSANGINASGQVIGVSSDVNGNNHGVLWSNGTMTDLGAFTPTNINSSGQIAGQSGSHAAILSNGTLTDLDPVGAYSYAYGINDSGKVVGYSYVASDPYVMHATLWDNGTATDLGTLGGRNTWASGINASGKIVGYSDYSARWDGVPTSLGSLPLGAPISQANAINASGQAVGSASVDSYGGVMHATLWDHNGVATDLGSLGAYTSEALAINATGEIVGSSFLSNSVIHATLWKDGYLYDLNSFLNPNDINAGWVLQTARGINDNGDIVGTAVKNGQQSAFLLSVAAVPEIETPVMFMIGLGLIGFLTKRLRKTQS